MRKRDGGWMSVPALRDSSPYAATAHLISYRTLSSLGHDLQINYNNRLSVQRAGETWATFGSVILEYTLSLSEVSEDVEFQVFDSNDHPAYDVIFSSSSTRSNVPEDYSMFSPSDYHYRSTMPEGHVRPHHDITDLDRYKHLKARRY